MEREELEKWLKQSFYPYFYVNSTSFGEFDAFDVENYADVMGEDKVEAIRENISDYWGIHDRKRSQGRTRASGDCGRRRIGQYKKEISEHV